MGELGNAPFPGSRRKVTSKQLLKKHFNKMKSVQNLRDIDRSKKDPTRSPLRCANGNSPIKCRVTCDVCRQIEQRREAEHGGLRR